MTQQFHLLTFASRAHTYSEKTLTFLFIAALLTIVKIWQQHKYPRTDDLMEKIWFISVRKYYSAIGIAEII